MLNRITHEKYLSDILYAFYRDKSLATILGFKGGTACYFFYDLPRFSTDLDFDLLDLAKAEKVFNRIAEILADFGVVNDKMIKAYTIYFFLSYEPNSQGIKVEINTRNNEANKYGIKNLLGLPILAMNKDCVTANKLIAIFSRKRLAHRDLFDAWFMLTNNWPINEEVIYMKVGMNMKNFFEYLLEELEKLGEINILHGLGEVLDRRQKIWVKQNLLEDLKFQIKLYAKHL